MRVAVVTEHVRERGPGRGGSRTTATARGLGEAGHEVAVVTPRWWGHRHRRHHARWSTHHLGGGRRLVPWSVARTVASLRPGVVHLADAPPTAVLAAAAATVGRRSALVYEVVDFDSPLLDGGWATRRALARLDRVIVPSGAVRTALLEAGHDPTTTILGDPIDLRRIGRVVPNRAVDVAWVGPGHRRDDLEAFLLALAELRDREWTAALLGPFDGLGDVATEVDDLGLTARIRVAPRPTPRERLAVYRGAATVVQTTPVCAFPTELVWAQAAGCTAVVQYRERSSAHEPVEAHGRGTLVSTPDELPGAIADALNRAPDVIDATFAAYDRGRYVEGLESLYGSAVT